MEATIIFAFFLIFLSASIIATISLYTRQSLLVAYILVGILLGPFGLKYINNIKVITEISSVGIMFLLFLLGLNLHPKDLFSMLKNVSIVTIASAGSIALLTMAICYLFSLPLMETVLMGLALMFSSTILGLKLLPTQTLQREYTGKILVGILLLQDIIAIIVLLVISVIKDGEQHAAIAQILTTLGALPALGIAGYIAQKFLLAPLLRHFEQIKEYVFLVAIGWCLTMAVAAHVLGLSYEIGAFIAGVSLAATPFSDYIANNLRPLRDFFLVVFFFTIGASFNFRLLPNVIFLVIALTALVLLMKPLLYRIFLRTVHEAQKISWEVGIRLGQASEFSLLVAFLAYNSSLISQSNYTVIQAVTILTFIFSSYLIVFKYPSPMSFKKIK